MQLRTGGIQASLIHAGQTELLADQLRTDRQPNDPHHHHKRQHQTGIPDSSRATHDNPLNSREFDTYPLTSRCRTTTDKNPQIITQYKARTGSVTVPRGHVEQLEGGVEVRLGVFLSNSKSRRAKLTADKLAALANLGLEWAVA